MVVRLLNNIGCALFEMNELEESKVVFDEALSIQRCLMRENKDGSGGGSGNDVDVDDDGGHDDAPVLDDPKDAHSMLLSIALTLCNLGSIHLRWGKYDESIVSYEEALLVSSLDDLTKFGCYFMFVY